ncbi:unnamed protein product [Adineta steineri]|uniref:Apple domain-containing protein n=2 Tax=Adineta steineri TaxID=433720 RepID=A0A818Y6N3_9BILA|nr:unnamed protein product [Adineta steineri]CAF1301825.1 unnamed protein product [Adineta steineri]CAF1378964.1 unnamed protein product [Adineta steineri]CAF3746206.1 unnamed protein product [Adineta steineri]CAF3757142.1 unnamed protein product [Adineta steineri]
MQSSIIAFILVGIVVISQTSARSLYNNDDDDFAEQFIRALSDMKRGAPYHDVATNSRCLEFVVGKDNYGGDMDASQPAQVRSAAACAAICDSYPDCTAWTFNVKSGSCWTKDKKPSLSASPDAITGTCKASTK